MLSIFLLLTLFSFSTSIKLCFCSRVCFTAMSYFFLTSYVNSVNYISVNLKRWTYVKNSSTPDTYLRIKILKKITGKLYSHVSVQI